MDSFNNTVTTQIKNNKSYLIVKACNFKKEYLKKSSEFISHFVNNLNISLENSENNKIYLIVDAFNFKSKLISIPFIIKFINTFKRFERENNKYNDIFKRIVIINYNPGFKIVFDIVKPFVDKKRIEMVEFINRMKKKDIKNDKPKVNFSNVVNQI